MPGVLFRLGARQYNFEVFRFCSWGAAYTDPHHFARSLVPKSQSRISNLANGVIIDVDDDRAFFSPAFAAAPPLSTVRMRHSPSRSSKRTPRRPAVYLFLTEKDVIRHCALTQNGQSFHTSES